jgi:hypothetical protein
MFPVSTPNFLPTFPTVLNRGSLNYRFNTSFPAGETVKENLAIDLVGNNILSYPRGGEWESVGILTSIARPNATVVHSNNLGGVPIFNGVNSNFTGTTFEPSRYTMCCWFKGTGPPNSNDAIGGSLLAGNGQIGLTGYLLCYSWLNSAIYYGQDGSTASITSANNSAPRNTIIHVAIRFNGATRDIYINGLLSASNAFIINPGYPTTGDRSYRVGSWGTAAVRQFNGEIYRVSMYDRALSVSEILQNYTSQRGFYGV